MRFWATVCAGYFALCFTTAPNVLFWLLGFSEGTARTLWFITWGLSGLIGYGLWKHLRDHHPTE